MNESAEKLACACCGNSIYRLPLIVLREEDGRFIMAEGKKLCTKLFVAIRASTL